MKELLKNKNWLIKTYLYSCLFSLLFCYSLSELNLFFNLCLANAFILLLSYFIFNK